MALAATCALITVGARAMQQRTGADQGMADLARRLEEAVNAANTRAAAAITAPGVPNDYTWIAEWKASGGNERRWRAAVLSPPGGHTDAMIEVSRPQLCESTGDHLYTLQRTSSGWRLGREVPETEPTAYRVESHAATVVFDRAGRRATIDNTVSISRTAATSAAPFLRLNCYYRVRDVRIGNSSHPFVQSGGFLALAPLEHKGADLRFQYSAPLPATGESFVGSDEAALTAYWYPHIARLPVTSDLSIVGPAAWKCIGPGKLIEKRARTGVTTWRWQNHIPVSFLTVAGGSYHETVRRGSSATARVWLLDPNESRAEETLDVAVRALDWFSARFGAYPYPDFTVVESRVFPPALEGYSFTLAGAGSIPGAVSHEVSHTWWGGLVPNTYTRSMWNESLATYTDGLFVRPSGSDPAGRPGHGAHASARTLTRSIPLTRATDAMNPGHAAVGYGKGALVLEQLERLIGTDRMEASLRVLVSRHRRGTAAEWSDIADAVAESAGSEWRGFFPPWLQRSELPQYDLRDVSVTPTNNGHVVTGAIVQTRPAFWSLAEIVVHCEGGAAESVDVHVRSDRTPFRLATRRRPVSVALDPQGEMLRSGPLTITVAVGDGKHEQPRR